MGDIADHDPNNNRPLPLESKSKRLMAPDVPKALETLAFYKAEDLIDVLGLRNFSIKG